MEYINRFLQRTKSGGGAPKAKTGFRPDPLLDNKGDFGEDSFQSDKGDQLSECSFTSALTKVLDTDTDTTAEYESASETEGSPSSPAGDTTCTTLSGGDITVVAGPGGSGDHDLSMLANDMGGLYLSTPCTSKHRKRGGIGAGDADDFYHVIESVTPKENGLSPRSPTTLSPILPKPRLLSESEAISDMLERSFSEAFPDCPDTREELEAAVAVGPCDSLTDSIDTIDSQEGLHLSSRQDGENLNRSENKSFFLNNSRGVNSLEALFHGLTMQDSKAVAESIQKNSVSEWVNGTEGVSLPSNAESPERLTSPGRDLSRISEENYDSLQDYARPTKATDQLNVQVPNDVTDSTTAEEILKIVNQSEDQNSTFEVIQENIELSQIKSPGQTSQNVTQLPETLEYCESVIKSSSNIVEDSLEGIVPIERQSGVGEAVSKELCYESPVKAEITSEGLVSYDSGSETERSLSSPIMDPTDTLPSGSDVTYVGSGGSSDLSMLANMMGGFYLSTPCSARKREKVVEDANTSYIVTESVSPIKENGKSPRSQMSPIPFASRIECLEVVPKELPALEPINSLVRTEISVEESIKASESFEIQVTSSDSVVKESSNQDSSVQSSINISDGEIAKSPTKMSEAINHEMPNTPEPTESQMKEFPKTLELTKSSTKPAIFSEEQPKLMEPSEYASPKEVAKEIPSVLEPVESSIEISVSGEEPKPEETCKSPTKICEFLNHSQEFSEISKHTKSPVKPEIFAEELPKAVESQHTASEDGAKEMPSSLEPVEIESSIEISVSREEPKPEETCKSPTKICEFLNRSQEFSEISKHTKSPVKPEIFAEELPKAVESQHTASEDGAKEMPSSLEPVEIESSIEISVSREEPKPEETCKSPTKICEFLNRSQEFSEISKHTKSPVKPEIFAEELPKAVESQHIASEDGAKEMPSSLEPVEIESSIEISVSREEPKPEETCKSPTKICEFLNRSQEFSEISKHTKSPVKPEIFAEELPKAVESQHTASEDGAKEMPSSLEPVEIESSIEISVSREEPKPEETCKSPTKICEFLNRSQEFSEISKHTKSPVKPEIFAEELPKAVESQHIASEGVDKVMLSALEPVEIESSIEISVGGEEQKPEKTCKSPTKICELLDHSQEFSEILKHTKSPVKPEIFAEEVAKEIPSAPEVIQSSVEISVSGKTSEAMSRSPSNIYEAVSHELPKTPETFESLFKMCEVLPENLPEVPKSIEELVQASEPLESPVDIALEPVAKDLPKDLEPLVSEVIATESVAKEIAIVLELKESPVKSSIVNFEELSKPEEVFKSPTKISEVSKTPEPIETQIESLSVLPEEVSKVLEPTKSPAKAEILAVELPKIMEPTTESQLTASDIFVEPKAEEPIENLLEESKIAAKELSKSLEPIEAIVQESPQASGSIESKPLASHIAPMELSEALVKTESPVKDKTFVEESSKVLKSFDIAPEVVANGVPKAQELFESQVTDFEMVAKELPKIQEGIDNSIKTPVNIDESKTEETLKSPAKIHEIVNHELPKSPERIQSQIESLPLLQNLPEVPYDSPLKGEVFVESFVKAPEPFGSPIITISEVVNQELSKTPEHIKIKDGKDICMDLSEVPEITKTATETEIFVEKLPKAIEPTESQHTAFKSIFNEIPKVLEPAGSPIEIPIKEEAKPVESFKMSEVVKHALAKYSESLDWSLPKPLDVIDGRVSSVVDRDTVKRQHDKALSDLMATAHKQEIELELAIATPDDDLARPITSADDFDIKFDPSFTEEAERLAIDVLNSSKSLTDESDSDDGKWGKTTPQADLEEHIFMPKSMVGQTDGARSLQCMMRPAASPDINRSEAGPVTADEHFHQGEDAFQDAASFDFEYLAKVGRGTGGHSLARQSLFVKFDPLVNNQANPSVKTMNESIDTEEEEKMASETGGATPKKMLDGLVDQQPVQRLISVTPPRTETPTKTRTMANSPATPTLRQDILSKEISKLQELMMQQEQSYQEQLTSRTEEVEDLRKRVDELETREPREDLEEKLKASEAKTAKLKKELAENALGKKQLTMIMEEYEKTISQLVTKREDEKKEFEQVKETIAGERDMALQHLSNMEVAFNDIHQKYEKAKAVIESMKINEQLLKESLAENEKTIKKQEGDYQKLKKHASEKLEVANKELLGLRKAHQAEVAKLRAIAKKSEIKVKSLEESLEQKNKEVRELTQICDELIDKVENH